MFKKNQQSKKTRTKKTLKRPSLIKEIAGDMFVRHWFLVTLVIMLVYSAMLMAKTSHDVRRSVAKSQQLSEVKQQLEIEKQTLRLEMTSLSETDRIASLAKRQLEMVEVTVANEKIISR